MKKITKNSRRAFTIVELVIVIAVVAILAAVLIPTFVSVIDSANKSADLQECKNAYTQYLGQSEVSGDVTKLKNAVFVGSNNYCYMADENGQFDADTCYKIKVLNKNGTSSSLREDNVAICIPAGETMYVITGATAPTGIDYHAVKKYDNTYGLIYTEYTGTTNALSSFGGKYVVFDNELLCYVDSTTYKITGYSISEGVTFFETDSKYDITLSKVDGREDGYCTITTGSDYTAAVLTPDQVLSAIGISGVTSLVTLTASGS